MEGNIKAALQLEGFEEELTGEYKPPVAAYTLGGEQGGFYVEFLTPMVGSGVPRVHRSYQACCSFSEQLEPVFRVLKGVQSHGCDEPPEGL